MEHGSIISDLAIVLVCAALVTVIFRALKLPVLLGYLLSGFLVGPNFFASSPLKHSVVINELSELGVAFLMFSIGLEFDLAKVKRIFGAAFLGVLLQTVAMFFIGIMTAPLLGWSSIEGLFLGSILAISSTMITVPFLESQGQLKSNFGQLAIGMLILEDILAIIVLVILSGVGVTGKFQWSQAWQVIFFVGVFVVMVYYLGRLFSPKLVKFLRSFGSYEMITVVAVAMLLGIGELAEIFNFSIALGAFLAGSLFVQSDLSQEIEHAIEPLKNLFSAVFFVTIGMRIQPNLLAQYWVSIVSLSFLVVGGKLLTVWLGLYLSTGKAKISFKAALCKAQIGEFSFVIAGLGLQYGVTDSGIMTLAIGVSLGSIIILSFAENKASALYELLYKKTPQGVKDLGDFYNNFLNTAKEQIGRSAFIRLAKGPLFNILFYFFLFNGVLLVAYLSIGYVSELEYFSNYKSWIQYGIWFSLALFCLPFLIGIIRNIEVVILLITESVFSIKTNKLLQKGRIRNILNSGILCIVLVFLGGLYLSVAASFMPTGLALLAFIALVTVLILFFWRQLIHVSSRLEQMFFESFKVEVQHSQESRRNVIMKEFVKKHPWPIHLHDVEIKPTSRVIGKTIRELNLREKTGISIVGITRGNFVVYNPAPEVPLFPGDHLILIGKEEEATTVKKIITQTSEQSETSYSRGKCEIDQIFISNISPLAGSTLTDANIRQSYRISIIGIQRKDKKITSPSPTEILKPNDIVVVVGTRKDINSFKKDAEQGSSGDP